MVAVGGEGGGEGAAGLRLLHAVEVPGEAAGIAGGGVGGRGAVLDGGGASKRQVGSLGAADAEVVKVELIHVGGVVVTEGHIDGLAGIAGEVDSVFGVLLGGGAGVNGSCGGEVADRAAGCAHVNAVVLHVVGGLVVTKCIPAQVIVAVGRQGEGRENEPVVGGEGTNVVDVRRRGQ